MKGEVCPGPWGERESGRTQIVTATENTRPAPRERVGWKERSGEDQGS